MSRREPFDLDAYVRRLVDGMPPLTSEQRARLSVLLRPAPSRALRSSRVTRRDRAAAGAYRPRGRHTRPLVSEREEAPVCAGTS